MGESYFKQAAETCWLNSLVLILFFILYYWFILFYFIIIILIFSEKFVF